MSYNKEYKASKNSERETPSKLFNLLDNEFHFTLDAAASKENTKCESYLSVGSNALSIPWITSGNIWLNPPYSRGILGLFLEHAWTMAQELETNIVCLVPADPSTQWWKEHVLDGYLRMNDVHVEIRFLSPRVKFLYQGKPMKGGAMTPNAIVIYRGRKGSGGRVNRYWSWDLDKYY